MANFMSGPLGPPVETQQRYPGLKVQRNIRTRFILLGIIVLILGIMMIIYLIDSDECYDMDCFLAKANECQRGIYVHNDDGIIFEFTTDNCVFNKKIIGLPPSEPEIIKTMLMDKSFTCKYDPGKFDERLTRSLISGLEQCNGELKTAFYEIALAQYENNLEVYEI